MPSIAGQHGEANLLNVGLSLAQCTLAALLKTRCQKLLGAIRPLFLLLLNFPKEVSQVLITPGVAGVSLVILRPLESMIQNADEVVGRIAGARAVSDRKPPLLITTLAQPSGSA